MHPSNSSQSDSSTHATSASGSAKGIRRMSDAELAQVSGAGVGRVRRNASAARRGRIPNRRGRR